MTLMEVLEVYYVCIGNRSFELKLDSYGYEQTIAKATLGFPKRYQRHRLRNTYKSCVFPFFLTFTDTNNISDGSFFSVETFLFVFFNLPLRMPNAKLGY